ncbi:hypothetical protein CDIK_2124 [Cucumispora dikerogammari]|nr:hypothetical protein CDIK_2124 [Cucumispora dikerogammari]
MLFRRHALILDSIGLGFSTPPDPSIIYKLLESKGFKFFINNPDQHGSQKEIDIINKLHPSVHRKKVFIVMVVLVLLEFLFLIFKWVQARRASIYPLLSFIVSKLSLFIFMLFFNGFCVPKYIIPVIMDSGRTQIINYGYRLTIQFIFHLFIYMFIALTQTCLLYAIFSSKTHKPKHFKIYISSFWILCFFASFKEFFLYKIELSTSYYKYIHAIVYTFHACVLATYKPFWKQLDEAEKLSMFLSVICFLLGTSFYIFFSPPSFLYELFHYFMFAGTLVVGFPIWNRFLQKPL